MLRNKQICFIGGGYLAEAVIKRLLAHGVMSVTQMRVLDTSPLRRQLLQSKYGLQAGDISSAEKAIGQAQLVMLAVKPNQLLDALLAYGQHLRGTQLLISVVAGASTKLLWKLLPFNVPLVRAMPNTSAAVGLSATAICAGEATNPDYLDWAEVLFRSVGSVVRVDESTMDAITGLSGSGPAYVYALAEAMEQGGVAAGVDPAIARELTIQTLLGAAAMLDSQGTAPADLRRLVTSPGGTTMAGLEVMQQAHFAEIMQQAILSAARRSRAMAEEIAASSN